MMLRPCIHCKTVTSRSRKGQVSGFDSKGVEGAIAAEFHALRRRQRSKVLLNCTKKAMRTLRRATSAAPGLPSEEENAWNWHDESPDVVSMDNPQGFVILIQWTPSTPSKNSKQKKSPTFTFILNLTRNSDSAIKEKQKKPVNKGVNMLFFWRCAVFVDN